MTLETQRNRIQYVTDGGVEIFPVPFPVMAASDIKIYVSDDVDNPDTQTEITSGYDVVGLGEASATVVFYLAPVGGQLLTIMRLVPYTQEMSLENSGDFNAEIMEQALDRTVMQIQQLAEKFDRTISVPESWKGGFSFSEFIAQFRGPEGPVGPQGPIGDKGADGADGAQGEPGPPGTAPALDVIDCGGPHEEWVAVVDGGGVE